MLFLGLGGWQPKIGFHLRPELLALGTVILSLAFFSPQVLKPAASLWRSLSVVLHRLISPLILGILYFVILTPLGLILRLAKWDPLKLKLNSDAHTSYWQLRNPPGPSAESFKQQF